MPDARDTASTGELTATGAAVKSRPGRWHGAPALDAAITAWEANDG
ncbi:hypothetical protein KBZ21_40380 [Streptomyces sp. A73]|nr:hypothetical protein [Streptomyces sp. A73]